MAKEILFNEKINDYTLEEEIKGEKSVRKVPYKFKIGDKTAKYRKEILKEELDKN